MPELLVKVNANEVAAAAASIAAGAIEQAVLTNGRAVWVLAGGTAPIDAYTELKSTYINNIDWPSVTFVFGDERIVELNSPKSNFVQIKEALLDGLPLNKENILRPKYELSAEEAAKDYETALGSASPRFDHVWLGIGEDGHTLSLFPGHDEADLNTLVAAVHNSPKPPPDRISLTLQALKNVGSGLVIALGDKKAEVVKRILARDSSLPIVRAIETIESNGGSVTLLLDKEAASQII